MRHSVEARTERPEGGKKGLAIQISEAGCAEIERPHRVHLLVGGPLELPLLQVLEDGPEVALVRLLQLLRRLRQVDVLVAHVLRALREGDARTDVRTNSDGRITRTHSGQTRQHRYAYLHSMDRNAAMRTIPAWTNPAPLSRTERTAPESTPLRFHGALTVLPFCTSRSTLRHSNRV